MKKRILHLLSSNIYSGAEHVVINILDNLSSDYEFVYVSPEGPISETLSNLNIPYIPIKQMQPHYLRKILKEWKPDIIHAHDFRASIISALSMYKCPKISHLHQNPTWIKNINPFSIAYLTSSFMYDMIITVSSEVLEKAIFGKVVKNKSRVLNNYVDISKILKAVDNSNFNENFDVAFIGRLEEAKDPLKFIELMKSITKFRPGLKIVMIGDGELRDECTKMIKLYKLEHNIKMTGFLKNPYVFLSNSKVLVITSKWEGFGLVAIEAMALGKPVLAPPVGGLKSIVSDDCGGLYRSNEDFVDKILNILDTSEDQRILSKNCKEKAAKYTDKEKWRGELKKIYEKM